jgi:hypothetical protein
MVDYIGHPLTPFKEFSGWGTIDPSAPPSPGAAPFSLLDEQGLQIPGSEGWAVPYGDKAYDLGPIEYRGEYWGYRIGDQGYVVLADRNTRGYRGPLKNTFSVRFKFVFNNRNITRVRLP